MVHAGPAGPRLKASIGITTVKPGSDSHSGVERAGRTFRPSRQGHGARAWAGRQCQGPRRDRRPGEVARARSEQGDGSQDIRPPVVSGRGTDVSGRSMRQGGPAYGSLSVARQWVHPLSFLNDLIRPSALPNPRSFGPSCRSSSRSRLLCCGSLRTGHAGLASCTRHFSPRSLGV